MDLRKKHPEHCTINRCERPYLASGLCKYHYDKRWRGEHKASQLTCHLTGCSRQHYAKGMCYMHYRRSLRCDDPRYVQGGWHLTIRNLKWHLGPDAPHVIKQLQEKGILIPAGHHE